MNSRYIAVIDIPADSDAPRPVQLRVRWDDTFEVVQDETVISLDFVQLRELARAAKTYEGET